MVCFDTGLDHHRDLCPSLLEHGLSTATENEMSKQRSGTAATKTNNRRKSSSDQRRNSHALPVKRILSEFEKEENSSSSRRKGTFKIPASFEDALDTILKSKPDRHP